VGARIFFRLAGRARASLGIEKIFAHDDVGAGQGPGWSRGFFSRRGEGRQPTRPMAAASRMLSNDDRVKIAILYKYSWSKTARQVTPFGKQGQISAKVYSFAPALKTKNCAAMRRPAPRQGWV